MTAPSPNETLASEIERLFERLPLKLRPQRMETDNGEPCFGASRNGFYLDLSFENDGRIEFYGQMYARHLEPLRSVSPAPEALSVEAVARAICGTIHADPSYTPPYPGSFPVWMKYTREAEAVLAFLSSTRPEPSELVQAAEIKRLTDTNAQLIDALEKASAEITRLAAANLGPSGAIGDPQ